MTGSLIFFYILPAKAGNYLGPPTGELLWPLWPYSGYIPWPSTELLSEQLRSLYEVNPDFTKGTKAEESWEYYFFEMLKDNINKLLPSENFSFFVCSFSEERDLLSQWRGYCKNGSGYSLGFALSSLQSCVKRAGFAIKPCVYDRQKQIDAIR